MNVHVIFAHPQTGSFAAAVHRIVLKSLAEAGHEVADLDLYRANVQPCLSARERATYYDRPPPAALSRFIKPLRQADALVFIFPVWWFGPPAILKGYLERVWRPGVAYDLKGGDLKPRLQNVKRVTVITSYGAGAADIRAMGDPVRTVFAAGLTRLCSPKARLDWNPLHNIETCGAAARQKFLDGVARKMARL
jgi:NAD(P)H dehydrogenase (quinone)